MTPEKSVNNIDAQAATSLSAEKEVSTKTNNNNNNNNSDLQYDWNAGSLTNSKTIKSPLSYCNYFLFDAQVRLITVYWIWII